MIRVVIANPGDEPQVKEIENSLEAFQQVVGGYVEGHGVGNWMTLFVNEEGVIRRMTYNRKVHGVRFFGPMLIAGMDENGDQVSLTPEQTAQAVQMLSLKRQVSA